MLGRHLVVRGLQAVYTRRLAFPPTIIPLVVEDMGPARTSWWCATNLVRYVVALSVLGSVWAHLTCVVVSLRNGCGYCSHDHVYAFKLLHLRDHGKLLPWDSPTWPTGWVLATARCAGACTRFWPRRVCTRRRSEPTGRRDQGAPRRAAGGRLHLKTPTEFGDVLGDVLGADHPGRIAGGQPLDRSGNASHAVVTPRRHSREDSCSLAGSSPTDLPRTPSSTRSRHPCSRCPPSRWSNGRPRPSRCGPDPWGGGPPLAGPSTPTTRWQASNWRIPCCPPTAAGRASAG